MIYILAKYIGLSNFVWGGPGGGGGGGGDLVLERKIPPLQGGRKHC